MNNDHFGTREEMIDRYRALERELAEEKQRRERAEGFLAGIAESMGDAGYPLAVDTVHAFLRDTADPNVNWSQK